MTDLLSCFCLLWSTFNGLGLGWLVLGCYFLWFRLVFFHFWIVSACMWLCLFPALRWSLPLLLFHFILLSVLFGSWGCRRLTWFFRSSHSLGGHRTLLWLCFLVCILGWSISFLFGRVHLRGCLQLSFGLVSRLLGFLRLLLCCLFLACGSICILWLIFILHFWVVFPWSVLWISFLYSGQILDFLFCL